MRTHTFEVNNIPKHKLGQIESYLDELHKECKLLDEPKIHAIHLTRGFTITVPAEWRSEINQEIIERFYR